MTLSTSLALLAQAKDAAKDAAKGGDTGISQSNMILIGVALVAVLIFLVFLFIFFSFIRLWIQALLRADISIFNLIRMKLRNVDYSMIVRQKIALVQAESKSARRKQVHFLARQRPRPPPRSSRHSRPGSTFRGRLPRPSTSPAAISSKPSAPV